MGAHLFPSRVRSVSPYPLSGVVGRQKVLPPSSTKVCPVWTDVTLTSSPLRPPSVWKRYRLREVEVEKFTTVELLFVLVSLSTRDAPTQSQNKLKHIISYPLVNFPFFSETLSRHVCRRHLSLFGLFWGYRERSH